jgi:signal transduction histidine kinase
MTPAQGAPAFREDGTPPVNPILVFAPAGRDGRLAVQFLREAGLAALTCGSADDFLQRLGAETGAVLLTEEALRPSLTTPLSEWLRAQPAWSDLPIVLCIDPNRGPGEIQRLVDLFGRNGKVVVLDRPLRASTLASVLGTALEARRRQYEVRDLLDQIKDVNTELRSLNDELERRVRRRTRSLQARTEQVQRLAADLTTAEQRERSRIAEILHDHLQQLVFGIKLKVSMVRGAATDEARDDLLEQADALADEAMEATRTLTVELDPPVLDEDDMEVIMQWLASYFANTHDFEVEVVRDGACEVRSRELRSLLTQSVRELLFNAAKHAGVDEAHVRLESTEDDLLIHVVDDGQGFDPDALDNGGGGFGLHNVRERIRLFGADLSVDAAPGAGTRVTLRIPCEVAEEAAPEQFGRTRSAELGS